ncbi:MAG: ribose-5-phosphate isomerase RpiA [Candidatus Bathyarchaeia archaeon]
MSRIDEAKRMAAFSAVKEVEDKSVIGFGSGSTVALAIGALAQRIRLEKLSVQVVPASTQTELHCVEHGIPLTTLTVTPKPSLTIDGADQVDPKTLNVIKGGGAAHAREKVLASVSQRVVLIVDESKLSKGSLNKPVPVEVIPFAYKPVETRLKDLGGNPILRYAVHKNGPVITDNGNYVIDVDFGEIENPAALERIVKAIPGVVEVGLFIELVDRVYVGLRDGGIKILE